MSVLQYKEVMNSADLQIWNNVAFDNGDLKEFSGNKASWSPLKPILLNSTESLNSNSSSKENEGPLFENPISSVASSLRSVVTPFKQVNSNGAMENSKTRGNTKQSFEDKVNLKSFDEEIEEIEMEIRRLTSRLESLKLEKAERSVKTVEKRERVISAKFMEQKQRVKTGEVKKEIEQFSSMRARTGIQRKGLSLRPSDLVVGARRGMSMGPSEILGSAKSWKLGKKEMTNPVPPIQSRVLRLRPAEIDAEARRGMSMGPSEIFGSAKSQKFGKQEMITPIQPTQSRRKSCFCKLQDIDEGKEVSKERGKSSSVSHESRKTITKSRVLSRQAVTTVGSKKAVTKEGRMVNSIQPKKLFRDGEMSIPAKPLRAGRFVASRYNQSTNPASEIRKGSLPEDGKAENRGDKKRSLSARNSRVTVIDNKDLGTESRVKKRWEIPNEVVVHSSLVEGEKSPESILLDLLPRIRVSRFTKESPRDSGPAKRVVELVGKKSYFCNDEEVEPSVCQALSFAEEETEEN
ncbi:Hypothetical predicted protein [Olea europaea subsp. europaea]|uniref:Uncharacterized protein n=1 Tax=Olea europaea subsp. europaea TaxID=158383 RepID=A0A8S0UQ90_OLEEU|nr:Hypothetical predicted protein [Olea europaea subsp. europaea]